MRFHSIYFNKKGKWLSSYCKKCTNEYSRYHYSVNKSKYNKRRHDRQKRERRKIQIFLRSMKNRPCLDCGQRFPYWVMDFDHVRGIKKFNVSCFGGGGTAFKRVIEEVGKCEIVCSNCHRTRTFFRRTAAAITSQKKFSPFEMFIFSSLTKKSI